MSSCQINHVVSIRDLSFEDRLRIYASAKKFRANPKSYSTRLCGKEFLIALWQPSSRTVVSTKRAAESCGARVTLIHDFGKFSSEAKGESLSDSTRVIFNQYDCVCMRHGNALRLNRKGEKRHAPEVAVDTIKELGLKTKIVNLGTGRWEHPTQSLLDEYIIRHYKKKKLEIGEIVVAFVGDVKNSRTIHSLILLLMDYTGAGYYLVCPEEQDLPEELKNLVDFSGLRFLGKVSDVRQIVQTTDVFYFTRLQRELDDSEGIWSGIDDKTYVELFGITSELTKKMRYDAIVLHPLPRYAEDPQTLQMVSCEIPFWFDHDLRAKYFEQADNGFYVRAGLFLEMFS